MTELEETLCMLKLSKLESSCPDSAILYANAFNNLVSTGKKLEYDTKSNDFIKNKIAD